jgi:hypothetical protein
VAAAVVVAAGVVVFAVVAAGVVVFAVVAAGVVVFGVVVVVAVLLQATISDNTTSNPTTRDHVVSFLVAMLISPLSMKLIFLVILHHAWCFVKGLFAGDILGQPNMVGQPSPQYCFHRPVSAILRLCFAAGFVLDGYEEPSFAGGETAGSIFHNVYQRIPPALVCRLRVSPERSLSGQRWPSGA